MGSSQINQRKMWLTFVLAYVSVDLLGLAWIENQPSLGLFIPLILATAVLLIRSKILHRLMKKDKYSTAPSNIFLDNKNTAKELTQDLLSSSEDIVIPLEAQDFLIISLLTRIGYLLYIPWTWRSQSKFLRMRTMTFNFVIEGK